MVQILELTAQDREAVELGGQLGADGCPGGVLVCSTGRVARGGGFDEMGSGEVRRQPAAALRQGLRVRVNALDLGFQRAGSRHQALIDVDVDLGADHQAAVHERVERVADDPFCRVLNGHDAELDRAALDLFEDSGDRAAGQGRRRRAEVALDGLMRERAFRSQKGDAQALLERQAGADDLLEDRTDGFGRERAGVTLLQPIDDGALAVRRVEGAVGTLLGLRDLLDELCPAIQERQHLVVQPVDLDTQESERIRGRSVRIHGSATLLQVAHGARL